MTERRARRPRRLPAHRPAQAGSLIAVTLVLLVGVIGSFFASPSRLESARADRNALPVDHDPVQPLSRVHDPVQPVSQAAVELDTAEQREIAAYVREVFGPSSDRAFQLLACENAKLRPNAVNAIGNHPEGARDIGLFQINEYWQQTPAKFLFNWRVNVLVAKQLYDEQGSSFRLWSCGQKLGI